MAGGFEPLRTRFDLRQSLEGVVAKYYATSFDDGARYVMLMAELRNVDVPQIDYRADGGGRANGGVLSSWKPGRRFVYYAIEGPLLQRAVAGWIDCVVDAVSG